MKVFIRISILTAVFLSPALRVYAGSPAPIAESVNCAAEDMQLFYYYLSTEPVKERKSECRGGGVVRPGWLEKSLPGMRAKKVWREEGEDLSEAAVWQTPASILYEFADLTRKTLPLPEGGIAVSPFTLEAAYNDNRQRFILSLIRLSRSKLEGSFENRGKGLLSTMNLILDQMSALTSAVVLRDEKEFNKNAGDVLGLSRDLFAQLFEAPRGGPVYKSVPQIQAGYRGVTLPVPASQTMFLKSGDCVDMLVTFDAIMGDKSKELVTATILQNVIVLKVTDNQESVGVVQLMLNPQEAQYAALSLAQSKGNINLIRRAADDVEMHPMEIATFRRLIK